MLTTAYSVNFDIRKQVFARLQQKGKTDGQIKNC